jgi:multidrug resistance protein MdtO
MTVNVWSAKPWVQKLWQDLQPTPGRLSSTLRIVLASVLALILLLVLQMPFISVGLYFIFLIGRESPSVSLRSGIISFFTVVAAIAVELAVVIASDNDPMIRLLSVTVVTFLGGIVVIATSYPALGATWGLIYCTVIELWERHVPADTTVKTSLLLLGTFSVSLSCAIAVEYLFGNRDPVKKLDEQRTTRYRALETMFRVYAEESTPEQRTEAATRVSRLAVAGQSGMMELYNMIVDRDLETGTLPIGLRVRITMLAQLMDVAAAFGLQYLNQDNPELRRHCAHIAAQCGELISEKVQISEKLVEFHAGGTTPNLLDRVEGAIHALLTMPLDTGTEEKNKELVMLPSKRVPFFIPGALQEKSTLTFGLKISFCATLCYIIYHAIDWPGISTSVITVMVSGLSTSGATKQRLIFRLVASIIGGLVLAMGATAFLFPHMDSITSLIVLIAFVVFISAWTAAGPGFNHLGLQIAFSFYIVAFEGFSAPTHLAPARDRFIGILLALAVMWFVFDQVWPVRTVTVMRRTFAVVLRSGADLFESIETTEHHSELLQQTETLRDRVGKNIAALRTLKETVEYDFGQDRDMQIRSSEMILRGAITAAALIWNQLAVLHSLHSETDMGFATEPRLMELRRKLAMHLDAMADAVVQKTTFSPEYPATLMTSELLEDPHYGEYARNTVARYEELQAFVSALSLQV